MSETVSYFISISVFFSPCSLFILTLLLIILLSLHTCVLPGKNFKPCIMVNRGFGLLAADFSCICFVFMCLALTCKSVLRTHTSSAYAQARGVLPAV